ncbi:MAG TPA: glycosyltransferase family 4 protein [Gaiellaceae bacterium]|nr:glycosyltransferase family 4 protein [Gaiellaceae bacterium]
MRLVAYTDNIELGGADLSMAHVLERLDPAIDVTVLGVSPAIVERIAAVRPTASTRTVRRPSSGHDLRSLAAHVRAVRELAPDVVHANLSSPWSCQYGIAAAALARGTRLVAVYQLAVPPVSERQRHMKRLTMRGVDRHVGVGERTSRDVEELIGLPHGSVRTIHNGVPDQPLQPHPRPRPGPIIGAIGRIERQKGYDVLIRALAEVEAGSLFLVGDGSERGALEELAQRVGVADRVMWAGWSKDAGSFLRSFDVFALPSRFEGFPLALLEALLARSAVVATDVGSVAEVVLDGETGLLVPPEDPAALARAIELLLADSDLRRRLGEQGRRLVLERFTAAHMTRAFESLYDELLR